MNLLNNIKIVKALDYVDGTADRAGATLDMAGFDGVLMIVKFSAITTGAVTSIKAQQDTDSGMGTAADLLGTGITVADDDDNQIFVIDLYRPLERYVRVYVDKDTSNSVAEEAIYIQYQAHERALSGNVTNLVTAEAHLSPAEGTA